MSNARGLGTAHLDPSQDAIRGAAVLDQTKPAGPDLSIVCIRLDAGLGALDAALLRVNAHCMQGGC